ncbi:hypothetical protein NE237_014157 [Protea cynaroides]|uniref:Gag protein n=1 Tax=Protea cynaroides TaxID=273540 RepID=A0A9Q0JT08_9MAGN|nr:hypothetical protein NE237_014157 [Protea cynaroides]
MRHPILNGENYAEWLELLELTLGCINLDLSINEEKPEDLTEESTPDQRDYYAKWQRNNNMSLRLIKANMSRTIRRSIPDKPTAKEYLGAIKEQYVSIDSSTVSTLIAKLGAIKYSESKDVRDHIMKFDEQSIQVPSPTRESRGYIPPIVVYRGPSSTEPAQSEQVPVEPMPHDNEVVAEPVTQSSQAQSEVMIK